MKTLQFLVLLCLVFLLNNCAKENDSNKPTIYTVGDSTVKNGRGTGNGGLWGWGDFIGQFFNTNKIDIKNHALGGTSSRTYLSKGLWDTVHNRLKKGDFVLIQFGHNDNGPINDNRRARGTIKGIGDQTEEIDNILTKKHETVHTYGWYLRKIVTDAKSKGAIPVIMSPIPRNKWVNGKVPRNDDSYGLWAKQIAESEHISFIDLNKGMVELMNIKGQDKVTGTYFYKKDHTHTSAKGAVLAATVITDNLRKINHDLKRYLLTHPKIALPPKKNIFLIGDSTMANNNDGDAMGWGQVFSSYMDTTRVNVINKARGGRSSRTYNYEGLWDEAKKGFQKGDYVFIQFGHNDAGNIDTEKYRGSLQGIGDETQEVERKDGNTETVHTFGWYLKKMIQETKEKGAIPVILSLTPRNEWPDGIVEQRIGTYVKWAEETAKKESALYINLSDIIAKKYEDLGMEEVALFFPKDHTHTGEEGAHFTALTVAETLKTSRQIGLRSYVEIE